MQGLPNVISAIEWDRTDLIREDPIRGPFGGSGMNTSGDLPADGQPLRINLLQGHPCSGNLRQGPYSKVPTSELAPHGRRPG